MAYVEDRGTMRPDEFALAQRVFRQIIAEDWFPNDPERQQKFGAFVLRAYQGGNVEFTPLYDLCLRTARERFIQPENQY